MSIGHTGVSRVPSRVVALSNTKWTKITTYDFSLLEDGLSLCHTIFLAADPLRHDISRATCN